MIGSSLFFERLKREWKFQWGIFRSIADWTIIVYIIIPTLLACSYIYGLWWITIPSWIVPVPELYLFLVVYLYCWLGACRFFIEEADQLYLIQKKQIVRNLKKIAVSYNVISNSIKMSIIMIIFAPFLFIHYNLNVQTVMIAFIFFLSLKLLILMLKKWLSVIKRSWLKKGILLILFLILGSIICFTNMLYNPQFIITMTFVFLLTYLFIVRRMIRQTGTFFEDVITEKEEKLKYASTILQISKIDQPAKIKRKRPLLFSKSQRIFSYWTKQNTLVEVFIKILLRNKQYIFSLLRLIGISVPTVIIVPAIWLKWLLCIGIIIVIKIWLSSMWDHIQNKHFIMHVNQDQKELALARTKAVNIFWVPSMLFIITLLLGATMISL
ncbi:ABC transporter permease [Cytobacillus sp. IB215316]|uniref:ABC transporter permease n=1 Tax=Cytobacillus sp. IB215316 TaxID=3097354 RepID=UPI002A12495F|nr:ABC transporter permease [Cytobacillus sp. IB215316]MDX8359232.1 ABC transporter permease [Cytobacillus sp. IB215316]